MKVDYIGHYGDDLTTVNAARVSFHKESEWESELVEGDMGLEIKTGLLAKKDAKLIKYLADHKHFSPFNHSFISLRVKAPVFVARQLVKHKFLPWNEVSRRYVTEEPEFYYPDKWRAKAENVKQGSGDPHENQYPTYTDSRWITPSLLADDAVSLYEQMIKDGYCPEQARMVLPQNMYTTWIWSGTLGAFCDMLRLRLDTHTQAETRDIAQRVYAIIKPLFPVSVSALLGGQPC